MNFLVGFDCEPRDAIAVLTPDDGTGPFIATGVGRLTFAIDVPPTTPGWGATLRVTAEGHAPFERREVLVPPPLGPPVQLLEAVTLQSGTLGAIEINGMHFVRNGQVYTWCHSDGFLDYYRFLWGEDIRPQLEESQWLGFNGRRVIGMVDSFAHWYPQEFGDTYYDRLPEYFRLNAEYEQDVEFCVFADTRIVMPDSGQEHEHYSRVWNNIRPCNNRFLQLVNENDSNQNGIDIDSFPKPEGMLSSSGSNGTGNDPPQPFWDYSDLGSERRGDYALSTTTVHYAINGYEGHEGGPGFIGTHRPTVVSETPGCGWRPRRYQDPRIGYLLGLGTRWGNGGTFHSDSGILSLPLSDVERVCASEFVRGVKG